MTLQETVQTIAERLLSRLPAEQVWLFGSQARGEATADSDLDFLAVVEDSELSRPQRSREAHTLVADIRASKDIIVLTRREWQRQENVVNTIPYLARKEGVPFHSQ